MRELTPAQSLIQRTMVAFFTRSTRSDPLSRSSRRTGPRNDDSDHLGHRNYRVDELTPTSADRYNERA
jgi:hypothetical protein